VAANANPAMTTPGTYLRSDTVHRLRGTRGSMPSSSASEVASRSLVSPRAAPMATDSRLSTTTTTAVSVREPSPLTKSRLALSALTILPSSVATSRATTTRTRERLRDAEAAVDKLRRAVEDEHDLVERLKREGDALVLTGPETARRIRELRRDELHARAAAPRRATSGLFRTICSTDLLFLIDTTGSMGGYIEAAKQQVRSIVDDLGKAFLGQAELRTAVVGYKDHGDTPNIQFLDFTSSTDEVRSFLGGLVADGGNDAPEDVLGGIQRAIGASWKHQTRVVIHIADAPPHALHDLPAGWDSYATPGSEPHGLTHAPLLDQMVALRISYVLLRINNTTDRMVFAFSDKYAAASADCTLLPINSYASKVGRSALGPAEANAPLLFREAELGTTLGALQHLVVKAVTASAARTASRITKATRGGAGLKLTPISEDDGSVTEVELEVGPARWDAPGWLDETLIVEGFSPDVVRHGCSTLDAMMEHDDKIPMSVLQLVIHKRARPFAQGSLRTASYAGTAASANRYVVKSHMRADSRLPHLTEGMRSQALCKAFALDFNALTGSAEGHPIDFVVTACFQGALASSDACLSMEPYLEGTYVKYNSNAGYVNDDIAGDNAFGRAAQAFSHFTFERSRGRFLVCDLQGVGGLLTDPAVHTLDPDRFVLSETNLGEDGFKLFFATHECNALCRKLGLRSSGSTLVAPGGGDFRETWSRTADTVCCCSNKLCGKILRRTTARESDKFPGYQWCGQCWPQLEAFTARWVCVASGAPQHEFEVSRFFYESQGRSTPRKCLKHRGDGMTASRALPASVGSSASVYRTATASVKRGRGAAAAAASVTRMAREAFV